jgi:hypothetical protein
MRCSLRFILALMTLLAAVSAAAQNPAYDLGTTPTEEEIRAWDIAVGPSGKELPPGSGTVKEGEKIFAQRCAACHGKTGTEGPAPHLVGGQGTLNTPKPLKTPGSFWPFATTIWDYINRAMPLNKPGSLSADEVYSLTAFLLYRNDIIKETDVIDQKTLPKIQMPNRSGFDPPELRWKPGMRRPYGYYP